MDRTQAGRQAVLDSLVDHPVVRVQAQAGSEEEDGIVPPTLLTKQLRDANPDGLLHRANPELTTQGVMS